MTTKTNTAPPDFVALARAVLETAPDTDAHAEADVAFWNAVETALPLTAWTPLYTTCAKATVTECVRHALAALRAARRL